MKYAKDMGFMKIKRTHLTEQVVSLDHPCGNSASSIQSSMTGISNFAITWKYHTDFCKF